MPKLIKSKTKKIIFTLVFIALLYLFVFDFLLYTGYIPDKELYHVVLTPTEQKNNRQTSLYNIGGDAAFLMYYTMQSDIASILLVAVAFGVKNVRIRTTLLSIACAYMLLLIIAFWTMLAPFLKWNWLATDIDNVVLHLIIPFTIIFIWWKFANYEAKPWKTILISLIFPVAYYAYAWAIYVVYDGAYSIYPFFNFYNPFFLGIDNKILIILFDVGIFIILFLLCTFLFWLVIKIKNRYLKRHNQVFTSKNV